MPEASFQSISEVPFGYQLGIVREVLLALLTKQPARGHELRARLKLAVGSLVESLNAGQVYVTLGRLEKAGLVRVGQVGGSDRKLYELTPAGRARVMAWLEDVSWPAPAPGEFHLKLVSAAAAGIGDPVRLVDRQRRELLVGLREAQRAAMAEPAGSVSALLLDGVVLRLQADLRWLENCARYWNSVKE